MPYVDCAGVRTYYREEGGGDQTVVLLHGGLAGGDSWGEGVAGLAERYRVLVPDRRGHGRTADVAGPYTYEAMAEETTAFLEQVAGGPALLVGYSDGGNVALIVLRDRPELVRKAAVLASNFHHDGLHPAVAEQMAAMDPAAPEMAIMRDPYGETSPDGVEHWPVVARKVAEMGATGPTMSEEQLLGIEHPVLVVAADDDIVLPEHTLAMFHALPNAQLAIIPGTSHPLLWEKPALVMQVVTEFLAEDGPQRMMPFRKA